MLFFFKIALAGNVAVFRFAGPFLSKVYPRVYIYANLSVVDGTIRCVFTPGVFYRLITYRVVRFNPGSVAAVTEFTEIVIIFTQPAYDLDVKSPPC